MARRWREQPITVRINSPELRQWLVDYPKISGRSRNSIVNEAIEQYKKELTASE